MDNALYVGLSRQLALKYEVDLIANNIANASTTAFKAEMASYNSGEDVKVSTRDKPGNVMFPGLARTVWDFTPGSFSTTGRQLDVAIDGDGFFGVNGPNGPLYTRDGAFALSPTGELITKDGFVVRGDGGNGIQIPDTATSITIGKDGIVRVDGAEVRRLEVTRFNDPQALVPVGANRWAAPNGGGVAAGDDVDVIQGMLEGSNVRAVSEMTKLIDASRAYEAVTRALRNEEDLRSKAIERLGRPQ